MAVLVIFLGVFCRASSFFTYGNAQGQTQREQSRDGPEHPSVEPVPHQRVGQHREDPGVSPMPRPGPHGQPGRRMEPFSPCPVLFTACSASWPQGTETARPYESVVMNISPDLLTARALGPSGIHPLTNTTCDFRAAEIPAGWG